MSVCAAPKCAARAVHLHHIVTRQELRRHGGDPKDERGLLPLCVRHHERHHSRFAPLPLWVLPDAAFEFAVEVMGAGPAHSYLARFYDGGDPRLDALLEAEAA